EIRDQPPGCATLYGTRPIGEPTRPPTIPPRPDDAPSKELVPEAPISGPRVEPVFCRTSNSAGRCAWMAGGLVVADAKTSSVARSLRRGAPISRDSKSDDHNDN